MGRELKNALALSVSETVPREGAEGGELAVFEDDAFGGTGAAGSEDHIGGVVQGGKGDVYGGDGNGCGIERGEIDREDSGDEGGGEGVATGGGERKVCIGLGDDACETGGGLGDVEGDESGASFDHSQHGDSVPGRLLEEKGNDDFRADGIVGDKVGGETSRYSLEVGVSEVAIMGTDGGP